MLLLAVYGSPRKGGNTDLMLDAFIEGAASSAPESRIERLYVRDLQISGCLACGYCDKMGVCVQKDDMVRVYPLLDAAERIVIGSPIFFYGVTGQLKLLIDRSQAPFMRRELAKKSQRGVGSGAGLVMPGGETAIPDRRGFLLSAGATRGKRLFECAVLMVRYFFDALAVVYDGDLCFNQIDEKGAILRHPDGLEQCRIAGARFMSLAGKQS